MHALQLAEIEVLIDHGGHGENLQIGEEFEPQIQEVRMPLAEPPLFPQVAPYCSQPELPLAFIRVHLRLSIHIPFVDRFSE